MDEHNHQTEPMATCQVCKIQVPRSQLMRHNLKAHKLLFIGLPLLIVVVILVVIFINN